MMNFDPTGKEKLILKNSKIISRYIRAGKGDVVLRAPSGKAHRYAFLSPKDTHDFPEGTIFVYVFHNDHRYYLGMLDIVSEDNVAFRRTAKSAFGEDTEAVKGARFIVKMAMHQDLVDRTPMELYQSGRCCKCGKPLITTEGFTNGIGRKCLDKFNLLNYALPWDGNTVLDN